VSHDHRNYYSSQKSISLYAADGTPITASIPTGYEYVRIGEAGFAVSYYDPWEQQVFAADGTLLESVSGDAYLSYLLPDGGYVLEASPYGPDEEWTGYRTIIVEADGTRHELPGYVQSYGLDGSVLVEQEGEDGSSRVMRYLADGRADLNFASDGQGGVPSLPSNAALTLTVDTADPQLTIDPIGTDQDKPVVNGSVTRDDTLTLSGTASDVNLDRIEIYDGSTKIKTIMASELVDGAWTFTTNALDDGEHALKAVAFDVPAMKLPPMSCAQQWMPRWLSRRWRCS